MTTPKSQEILEKVKEKFKICPDCRGNDFGGDTTIQCCIKCGYSFDEEDMIEYAIDLALQSSSEDIKRLYDECRDREKDQDNKLSVINDRDSQIATLLEIQDKLVAENVRFEEEKAILESKLSKVGDIMNEHPTKSDLLTKIEKIREVLQG